MALLELLKYITHDKQTLAKYFKNAENMSLSKITIFGLVKEFITNYNDEIEDLVLMHGFTISFPFRKLHGFYWETQQF